jgi:hypothetical protein
MPFARAGSTRRRCPMDGPAQDGDGRSVTIWLIWMLPDESKVCFVMYAWRQLSRASMPWKVSPACVLSPAPPVSTDR